MTDGERNPLDMDKLVSLCKRRGYIFPGSDLYGGLNGTWDYGPLGVELKRNIKDAWWRAVVRERDDVVGLDAAILMHPQVWVASGHVAGFTDPMVDCKACQGRFRADQLDYLEFIIPNYVEIDFTDAQAGPTDFGDGTMQFTLSDVSVRLLEPEATNRGPLIKRVYLNLSGRDTRLALPVEDVRRQEYPLTDSPAPQELDGSGTLLTRKGAGGEYFIGAMFPRLSQSAAKQARSIRLELATPHFGTIFADYNLATNTLANPRCPECGGELTEPRQFNLMFKTFVGPVESEAAQVYLRPETAQGIFVNFPNVLAATRKRIPFGIAQIGKAFRNEINPRNFTYRSREFEQMELEFFCKPGSDEEWHQRWLQERFDWYLKLGLRKDRLRLRQHAKEELAHYAKDTYDIEYLFPWGWGELEGIANRTDFDLRQHGQFAGKGLEYFDDDTKEHYIPYVIEPSGGVDRTALAFLVDAYAEDAAPDAKGKEEARVVLRLHPALAPVKVAVLPLSRNEKLRPQAREVFDLLRRAGIAAEYDDAQSIGRRYRRQDEIGTPLCVTVDFQTVEEDQQVTIRDRDSMQQVRVPIGDKGAELVERLRERLGLG